jgi:hypothetical protein
LNIVLSRISLGTLTILCLSLSLWNTHIHNSCQLFSSCYYILLFAYRKQYMFSSIVIKISKVVLIMKCEANYNNSIHNLSATAFVFWNYVKT